MCHGMSWLYFEGLREEIDETNNIGDIQCDSDSGILMIYDGSDWVPLHHEIAFGGVFISDEAIEQLEQVVKQDSYDRAMKVVE